MSYFWIEFSSGAGGTVEAQDADEATEIARNAGGGVKSASILPYPAYPYISEIDIPAFCMTPGFCAGLTSCPKRPSCAE